MTFTEHCTTSMFERDMLTFTILFVFVEKTWRNEMDLNQVRSLWRNKPVQLNIANPGDLLKIHLTANLICLENACFLTILRLCHISRPIHNPLRSLIKTQWLGHFITKRNWNVVAKLPNMYKNQLWTFVTFCLKTIPSFVPEWGQKTVSFFNLY